MRRIKLEEKHLQWGLTAFLVILCCVLAFFAIHRFDVLSRFFSFCAGVLAPFVYGLVIAYLVCPIYNFTVRGTYSLMNRGTVKLKHDMEVAKGVGTVVSVLMVLLILAGIFWMIIPGLVNSVVNIVDMLPGAMKKMTLWINMHLSRLPVDQATIDNWMKNLTDKAIDFATDTILPHSQSVATSVSMGVIGAVGFVMDFVIGIIISVYFLNSKDTFLAQIKKLILATFKEDTATEIFEGASYTNRTFGGFINGKIIDSFIIGIICFLVMTVFGWEYSLLISCIVGITNIIPFFGPFIGAIPSVLLLLLVDPIHALYFIIFVLILQQFDGNILGPKILGESTGLDSFWVLFAVLVGGGLFGFIGMVIGIPVFAVIYYYVGRGLNRRLEKKGFSTDLNDYRIDPYRVKPKKKRRIRLELRRPGSGKGKDSGAGAGGKEDGQAGSDKEGGQPGGEESGDGENNDKKDHDE